MNKKQDLVLGNLSQHIEETIREYDNELKHTVNGKKEYVFKNDKFVGEGKIKFVPDAQKIIKENRKEYDKFIMTLNIKFQNISIVESTDILLHYKIRGNQC